jgi:6,7-dimethyl-8-ribityllumazine synthase
MGSLKANPEHHFAIIVSRYNSAITEKLLQGAIETLAAQGVSENRIDVYRVPGAWEIPVTAKKAAAQHYDAILCLGAVIKGETTHDRYINQQVSHSLGQLSMETEKPVAFGLLTCNNLEQAIHRSGGNAGNKGSECAETALEMLNLFKQIGT